MDADTLLWTAAVLNIVCSAMNLYDRAVIRALGRRVKNDAHKNEQYAQINMLNMELVKRLRGGGDE